MSGAKSVMCHVSSHISRQAHWLHLCVKDLLQHAGRQKVVTDTVSQLCINSASVAKKNPHKKIEKNLKFNVYQ
jgi:hypothetical protein